MRTGIFAVAACPVLLLALIAPIVSCTCNDESQGKTSVPGAQAPWGKLSDHVELTASEEHSAVLRLRQRASKQAPFRPYPASKERAVSRAERLLKKIAQPKKSLDLLEPPVDWGASPDKNRNAHFKRNAFRPLRPLISAHIASNSDRYLTHLQRVMLDWIYYNLIQKRKNAMKWYDMGTGLRAVVLAYLIEQELRAPRTDVEVLTKLTWAAKKHAEILSNPRIFTEGNHGMYTVLGLKALVHVLPELRGAQKYKAYADSKMARLLSTRFSKEGFHLEHSAEYHAVTIRSVQQILEMHLFDDVDAVQEALQKAESVAYQLYHPNGDRLMIGDSSRDGKGLKGVAPEHSDFIKSGGKRGSAPAAGLQASPDAGYAFYRSSFQEKPFSDHSYLFFAPGYHSEHHRHADHLGFEWSDGGQPILVDSGKFAYSSGRWREFFVSTRAGNAVEVDARDYSTRTDSAWGGGLTHWGSVDELQFMQASVRHKLKQGSKLVDVEQARTLVLLPHQWLCIIDRMSSPSGKAHTYRQWFHFHEDFATEQQGRGFVARTKDMTVHAQALTHTEPTLELARGQTKPRIQGWLSAAYRKKTKRDSIAFRLEGGSVDFVTLFSLVGSAQAPRVVQDGSILRISFTTRKRQSFIVGPQGVSQYQ